MWQSIESIASRCTKSTDAGSLWILCGLWAITVRLIKPGAECGFEGAPGVLLGLLCDDPLFSNIHSSRVWDSSSLVVSSNLRILHPIRLVHPHSLAPINTIRHLPVFFSYRGSRLLNPVVLSKDLHAPNMGIFSVLMVLQYA